MKNKLREAALTGLLSVMVLAACGSGGSSSMLSATADNAVGSYYHYTYDANGNRTWVVFYNGPGPDDKWF